MVKTTDSCLNCKNLFTIVSDKGVKEPNDKCKAFPEGIPIGILAGAIDHHEPIKGDNGIQYERNIAVKISKNLLFKDVLALIFLWFNKFINSCLNHS